MYEVRVNGEKVWSTEDRVVRISGQSARGEMFAAGIAPTDGVVDLFVEYAISAGAPRLDEIEDAKQQFIKDVPEGTVVGNAPYEPAEDANKPGQTSEDLSGQETPEEETSEEETSEEETSEEETSEKGTSEKGTSEEETSKSGFSLS